VTAGAETRARLITTAERLFAAKGIEGVSLREITRESGARNAIATQYHFKDRAGVVDAIMSKHSLSVDTDRHALMDDFESSRARLDPPHAVRALAGALVKPLAAKLSDPDGGPEFLQIYAEQMERLSRSGELPAAASSLARWRNLIDPLLERDAVRLHRRFTAILYTAAELGRRAGSGPHTDDRLFTSYLVDVVTAILSFPVSSETRGLADERDRAVRARSGSRQR
jgi:AcrR family transcriptional regulator